MVRKISFNYDFVPVRVHCKILFTFKLGFYEDLLIRNPLKCFHSVIIGDKAKLYVCLCTCRSLGAWTLAVPDLALSGILLIT